MSKQLHKNFSNGQFKLFLKSYLHKKIKINYVWKMFKILSRRFFVIKASRSHFRRKYRVTTDLIILILLT